MRLLFLSLMILLLSTCSLFALTSKERAEAYYKQGYLYYLQGNTKEAIPEFKKAINLDPNMTKAYYWIAKISYNSGDYKRAYANAIGALQINPRLINSKDLAKRAAEKLAQQSVKTPPASVSTSTTVSTKPAETKAEIKTVKQPSSVKSAVIVLEPTEKTRLISMDLRNVDISSVLEIFSRETGISIVAGKDVYGKVTVMLNKVTAEDALNIILKSNGYTYSRKGNVVEVYSSGEPTRIEELPGGLFVRTFTINYIGPDELKETVSKLMPETVNIYTTKGSNTVVVKGSANEIRRADMIIRNLDIPPRQVMVEAKIMEVSLNESQNMGVNASWTNPKNALETAQTVGLANPPTASGAMGLYYTVTNQDVTSLMEALSTRTGFNILSSPKVMALNNQTAEIITGSRLGYKVKTVTTTGMVESVEFLDVGTKLVITPSIKSDGLIVMEIHPEISEGAIVGDLPQKNSTETTTKLIVKDGQTIIIGGLIRDTSKKEVKGVPLIMDIPIIGMFFKRTDLTSEKKEVIVLISPHIINAMNYSEMESKIKQVEKDRKDITPSMNLDLVR